MASEQGASTIGIQDINDLYTGNNVEDALKELGSERYIHKSYTIAPSMLQQDAWITIAENKAAHRTALTLDFYAYVWTPDNMSHRIISQGSLTTELSTLHSLNGYLENNPYRSTIISAVRCGRIGNVSAETKTYLQIKLSSSYNPSASIGVYLGIARSNGKERWNVLESSYRISEQDLDQVYFEIPIKGENISYRNSWLNGNVYPITDNTINIGSATQRFKDIYAGNGSIITSDERLKELIKTLEPNKATKFLMAIDPISFKFKDGNRTHFGFSSQQLYEAMKSVDLTDMDFAGFIKSPVYDPNQADLPEEERDIIDYSYGIRDNELIPVHHRVLQDLVEKIECMESELKTVRSEIVTQKS